jgi:hypothetical protein
MIRRLPWELTALPLLGIAWALPDDGAGLAFRLGAATACLLVPGALIARALGRPSVAATLAWSLGSLFVAAAVMFAVRGPLELTLGSYAGIGLFALPFALTRSSVPRGAGTTVVALVGLAFGLALWHAAPQLGGDALFHLARVRKLLAFDELGLTTVNEFENGSLHPGYAFPLWHVFLGLVAKVGGVDAGSVLRHEATVLVPLAFAVTYEAGVAVFRSAWAGVSALLAQVAIFGLAPGHGGSYPLLALPATASRQLLVPVVLCVFFLFVREPSGAGAATIAAAGLALALVHPTYAIFVAIPLAGFVVVRMLVVREDLGRGLVGLVALGLPAGAVSLWLLPLARETASVAPSLAERVRGLQHYAGQLEVFSFERFRLAPEVFPRTGAVAVAALLLVPLAAAAARTRWAAFVLGGSLVVLALMLIPELFTPFSDLVSVSQSRRAAGFLPFAFAFAGGALVLARLAGLVVLPIALGVGIALQELYPGDFGYGLEHGGPAWVTWVATLGGLAALVAAVALGRRGGFERPGALAASAAALFVFPVAVHGFANWDTRATPGTGLTPGLITAIGDRVEAGSVVYSDDQTSYRIAAEAPVYVAVAPPGHVADTEKNRPYERRDESLRFLRTGDLAIPRGYGADWIVLDRRRTRLELPLERAYGDARYVLYRLRASD